MIAAGILAGGVGKRMGYTEMPKQFLSLAGKPIIIHTVEKFLYNDRIDKIIIGCVKSYVAHTEQILKKYDLLNDKISVIEGGADRNGTIYNIIKEMRRLGAEDGSIAVTHDAIRPFVSSRIINENIDAAMKYGVCDTAIPAYDTVVKSIDGDFISEIPVRKDYFLGQTPQSFKIEMFENDYTALSDEQKEILTDACKIFVLAGKKVNIVDGEVLNIKITTPYDLKIANALIAEELHD